MKKFIVLLLLCAAHNSWGAEAEYVAPMKRDPLDQAVLDRQIRELFENNFRLLDRMFAGFKGLYPLINEPHYRVRGEKSLLDWAAEYGNIQIAEFLVEKGADVNLRDGNGTTALFHAAAAGKLPMVKWLISKGADKDITNFDNLTPYTAAKNHFDTFVAPQFKQNPEMPLIKNLHNDVKEVLKYLGNLPKGEGAGASPARRPLPRPALMGAGPGAGADIQQRSNELEQITAAINQAKELAKALRPSPDLKEIQKALWPINQARNKFKLRRFVGAEPLPMEQQNFATMLNEAESAIMAQLRPAARPAVAAQPAAQPVRMPAHMGAGAGAQPSRESMAGAGPGATQSDVTLWQQINDILLTNKDNKYDNWPQNAKDAIDTVGSQIPEDSPLRAFVTHYYTRYDQLSPQDREKMVNAFKSDGALLFGAGPLKPGQKYKVRQLINTWFPTVSVRQEVEKILASKLQ